MGGVLPLLIGVTVFPLIIQAYGTERFGILAIAWSLVGYFSLFDMGLSRALTQLISDKLSKNHDYAEIAEMIKTAFRAMWFLGVIGGIVLWLISPWMAKSILSISPDLQIETIQTFAILSLSIPFVVHTSALRGVMDALHLFKQSSLIRMVLGAGTFLGPYFASLYSFSLVYAAYALIITRLLGWLMHWYAVKNTSLFKAKKSSFNSKWLKPLFSVGGWMTVSNIVGPLMVYLDRFVIAALMGTVAVAYYVAPYEVVTKLWIIPGAIAGVLFPIFAKEWHTNPIISAEILSKGAIYLLIFLFPVIFTLATFAKEGIDLWLGNEFSEKSVAVAIWLLAGVLINSVAQIFYAKVQGMGRADLTAKLHLAEALPYWILLYFAIKSFGIEGAAIAWFVRVTFDMLGLAIMLIKFNQQNKKIIIHLLVLSTLCLIPVLSLIYLENLTIKLAIFLIVMGIFSTFALKRLSQDNMFAYFKNRLIKND